MEQEILRLLAEVCGEDGVYTRPDLDLYENDLLDSLGLVELLERFEDAFNLEIYPTELKRADFGTPRKIVTLLTARLRER